jgi:hypothetical protein
LTGGPALWTMQNSFRIPHSKRITGKKFPQVSLRQEICFPAETNMELKPELILNICDY